MLVRSCLLQSTLLPPHCPSSAVAPQPVCPAVRESPREGVHPRLPYSKLVSWTEQEEQLAKVTKMQWVTHSVCPQEMDLPPPENHQGYSATPSRDCGHGVLGCPSAQPRAQTHRPGHRVGCWHNVGGTVCQFPPPAQKGGSSFWWDPASCRSLSTWGGGWLVELKGNPVWSQIHLADPMSGLALMSGRALRSLSALPLKNPGTEVCRKWNEPEKDV